MTAVTAAPTALSGADGPDGSYASLVEAHRRELLAHCYRMLGSIHDAEDALQETWLRAWRHWEARDAPPRPWLYAVATRVCIDEVRRRRRRMLPERYGGPSDGSGPPRVVSEPIWLEPFPDALLPSSEPDPGAAYDVKESVALAFVAALQLLPPRQRATLLLCDVLGSSAAETARTLGTTVASVTSALQRARATLRRHLPTGPGAEGGAPATAGLRAGERRVLRGFVTAWEEGDLDALIALLAEDVVVTMPPDALWFAERESFRRFLAATLFAADARGRVRLLPIRANGLPGFGLYRRETDGYHPLSLVLLELGGGRIRRITGFVQPELFPRFALPVRLPG